MFFLLILLLKHDTTKVKLRRMEQPQTNFALNKGNTYCQLIKIDV